MNEIVIVDLAHVTVDGETIGSIFDLAWNRPQLDGVQALALASLQAWIEARDQANAAQIESACKLACDAHANELADRDLQLASLNADHIAELAARDEQVIAIRVAHEADIKSLNESHAAQIAANDAAATATVKLSNDQLAAQKRRIEDQQAQIEALGGTELGQRLACEAKRAKLLEIKANAEAELAAIDGGA